MPVVGSQARQRCYDGRLCCPPRQEEIQSPPGLAGEVALIISMEKIQIDTEIYRHSISSKRTWCFSMFPFTPKSFVVVFWSPLFFWVLWNWAWVIWSGKAIGQLLVRVWSRRAWCLAALTQNCSYEVITKHELATFWNHPLVWKSLSSWCPLKLVYVYKWYVFKIAAFCRIWSHHGVLHRGECSVCANCSGTDGLGTARFMTAEVGDWEMDFYENLWISMEMRGDNHGD